VPRQVSGNLATARGVTNVNGVLQVEVRCQRGKIVSIVIHIVTVAHLARSAMPSAIMSYHAIAVL
jgi:hypothetical protein